MPSEVQAGHPRRYALSLSRPLTREQMSVPMKPSPWTSGLSTRPAPRPDEMLTRYNRGTRFVLSRDELLTLPEFVLLSLFPNGLFPEGHMGGFGEGDAVQVDVRAHVCLVRSAT